VDQETLDIILEIRDEGLDAIHDVKDGIADLTGQIDKLILVEATASLAAAEFYASQKAVGDVAQDNQRKVGGMNPILAALGQQWGNLTGLTQAIIISIVALTTVFEPFGAVVLAATTTWAGFIAGLAGSAAAIAIAGGGFAALAAGVVALTDFSFTAQQTQIKDQIAALATQREELIAAEKWGKTQQEEYTESVDALKAKLANLHDPLGDFEGALRGVGQALGNEAAPATQQMIDALTPLLPLVESTGKGIVDWFSSRLPGAIIAIGPPLQVISQVGTKMGEDWGHFFDDMEGRVPALTPLLGKLGDQGERALEGLLNNLVRLTDWFTTEEPKMEPVLKASADAIGGTFSGILQKAADLVDFMATHWPEISKNVQQVVGDIKAGWDLARPAFDGMLQDFADLGPSVKDDQKNVDDFHTSLKDLTAAIVIAVTVIGELVVIAVELAVVLRDINQKINDVYTALNRFISWLNSEGFLGPIGIAISILDTLAGKLEAITGVHDVHVNVITTGNLGSGPGTGSTGGTGEGSPNISTAALFPSSGGGTPVVVQASRSGGAVVNNFYITHPDGLQITAAVEKYLAEALGST